MLAATNCSTMQLIVYNEYYGNCILMLLWRFFRWGREFVLGYFLRSGEGILRSNFSGENLGEKEYRLIYI